MHHKVLRANGNVFIFKQYGSLSSDARCVKILLAIYSWKAVFFTENIYEDVACCADIIYKASLHEYNRIRFVY